MLKIKYSIRVNTGIILIILFPVITYSHWATYSRGLNSGLRLLEKVKNSEFEPKVFSPEKPFIKKDETFMSRTDTNSEKNAIAKSYNSRVPGHIKGNKAISKGEIPRITRDKIKGFSGENTNVSIKEKAIFFVSNFFGKDKGSKYERRFKYIKEALPQDKIIGYITDKGDYSDFFYTQYVLSPTILDYYGYYKIGQFDEWFRLLYKGREFKRDLVVGNFYNLANIQKITKSKNLLLVKDFGDGVLLLKHGEK